MSGGPVSCRSFRSRATEGASGCPRGSRMCGLPHRAEKSKTGPERYPVPNAMMHRRSPNGQPPVERKILIFLRTGERRFLVGSATRNTPKIRITASSAIRGDAGPHYTVHGNLISVRNGTTPEEIARGLGWPPLVFPAKISHPQASGGCLCPAPRPRSPLRPILKKKAN